MKLWLARHARPLIGKGICYGRLDVAADRQATLDAAAALARLLPSDLAVQVSGLSRARALADTLLAMRPDLRLTEEIRLNEMDFGIWEGVPWADIPKAAIDQWTQDFARHRFGGVESASDVLQRVASAIDDLKAANRREAVWITHAGVIRAVGYIAQHGRRAMASAHEWPVDVQGFGECSSIELP